MASTIILSDNGVSSGSAGLKETGGNDGTLLLQTTTSGGTATTAVTIGTDQSVTFAQGANLPNTFGFKNRIINGAMVIDQRNAGASITPATTGTYSLDRWRCGLSVASKYSAVQSSTAPTGFKNSLLVTSTSAYSVGSGETFNIAQYIEGYNTADLGWGAAGAATVTLSFWVRSSLTGTFGAGLRNDAGDRSYPFSYTISAANTWEQKTVTIPGDTTGTWLTTNGAGMSVTFSLGSGSTYAGTGNSWQAGNVFTVSGATSVVGTNGATFYITGVQLEKGSTATSFDFRPYGTELALCQRYYFKISGANGYSAIGTGTGYNTTTSGRIAIPLPVPMRSQPTPSLSGNITVIGNTASSSVVLGTTLGGVTSILQDITWGTAMSSAGVGLLLYTVNSSSDYFQCSAEL